MKRARMGYNDRMSDQEAISFIDRRLQEEGIRIKELDTNFRDGISSVEAFTASSNEDNCIIVGVYVVEPTEEILQERRRQFVKKTSSGLFLPTDLYRNEIDISVLKDVKTGTDTTLLSVGTHGGLATSVEKETPFARRLRTGDPLEKILRVAFEVYHTKYEPK